MTWSDYATDVCYAIKTQHAMELMCILYKKRINSTSNSLYQVKDIEKDISFDLSTYIKNLSNVGLVVPILYPTKTDQLKRDDKKRRTINTYMITYLGMKLLDGLCKFSEMYKDKELSRVCSGLYENRKNKTEREHLTSEYEMVRMKCFQGPDFTYKSDAISSSISKIKTDDLIDRTSTFNVYEGFTTSKVDELKNNEYITNILSTIAPDKGKETSIETIKNLMDDTTKRSKTVKRKDMMLHLSERGTIAYVKNPGSFYESKKALFYTGFMAVLHIDGEEYLELTPAGLDFISLFDDIEKKHASSWYGSISEKLNILPNHISADADERSESIKTYLKIEAGEEISVIEISKGGLENAVYQFELSSVMRDCILDDFKIIDDLKRTRAGYAVKMSIILRCMYNMMKCSNDKDECLSIYQNIMKTTYNKINSTGIEPVNDGEHNLRCNLIIDFTPDVHSFNVPGEKTQVNKRQGEK